jgi:WD40 repeat protein
MLTGSASAFGGETVGTTKSLVFSPRRYKTAGLWDSATGRRLHTLAGHTDHVLGVAFSPDGARLATASGDGTARLWDSATGRLLHVVAGHADHVLGVAFSPDGRFLATASSDKTAKLWDAATGDPVRVLIGHTDRVFGVAFSPDSALLATVSGDGTARLRDTADGSLSHTLAGHAGSVVDVAFSPDGTLLATASLDKTCRLWSVGAGQLARTLTGHASGVFGVAFSPVPPNGCHHPRHGINERPSAGRRMDLLACCICTCNTSSSPGYWAMSFSGWRELARNAFNANSAELPVVGASDRALNRLAAWFAVALRVGSAVICAIVGPLAATDGVSAGWLIAVLGTLAVWATVFALLVPRGRLAGGGRCQRCLSAERAAGRRCGVPAAAVGDHGGINAARATGRPERGRRHRRRAAGRGGTTSRGGTPRRRPLSPARAVPLMRHSPTSPRRSVFTWKKWTIRPATSPALRW